MRLSSGWRLSDDFNMSLSRIIKNIILLCILNICLSSCSSYKVETLSYDEVCSPVKKRGKLSVQKDSSSGLIIKNSRTFDNWPGVIPFHCRFEVKASSGDGVIAVIQNLSFRKHENGDCIDFVKFINKNREESKPYCGDITAFKRLPEETGEYAFVDPRGEVNVIIFVAKQKLMPHEVLELDIVFTSYRECQYDRTSYQHCGPRARSICIWNGFFGDNVVNCPVDCYDEETCFRPQGDKIEASDFGMRVTVGAVTTIILAFLLFMTCLWIMRRHKKLCWSEDCRGPRPTPPPTRVEMHPHLQEDETRPQPSAPLSQGPSVTISEDKDLPPSYESLFPVR